MLYEIIQYNFIGVAVITLLVLFIATNSNFDKKTNHLFLAAALCLLVLIIEEAWEYELSKSPVLSTLRIPLSALGYTLRPTTTYFLSKVMIRYSNKQLNLIRIPLIVNTLVAFSALFGGWSFSYSLDNQFIRGPLGYMPFITAGFYILLLFYHTIKGDRKGTTEETLTVIAIMCLTVIATVMESFFKFRSIQCACAGVSITFFYLFLHTNQTNRDPLTNALTRRKFYLDADKYRNSLSAVISLDLNDLKKINDKQGHLAGDQALITVTNVIKKHMRKSRALYRTGGDEFMILCYKMSEKQVLELIDSLRDDMNKTNYRCAIGYALHSQQAQLDFTCQIADNAMYQNKIQMKSQLQ